MRGQESCRSDVEVWLRKSVTSPSDRRPEFGDRDPKPRSKAMTLAESVSVGSELPPPQVDPISRLTLALFAGASGDHNPMHVDLDAAKSVGLPDVFAHGMLLMAYLGRLLTNWVPQDRI